QPTPTIPRRPDGGVERGSLPHARRGSHAPARQEDGDRPSLARSEGNRAFEAEISRSNAHRTFSHSHFAYKLAEMRRANATLSIVRQRVPAMKRSHAFPNSLASALPRSSLGRLCTRVALLTSSGSLFVPARHSTRPEALLHDDFAVPNDHEIGRASCRERV